MSYDLSFTVRPSAARPSREALKQWFASRTCYEVDDRGASYRNPSTGTSLRFQFGSNDDHEEARPVSLTIHGSMLPHVVGLEAEEEVAALVRSFDLLVDDPQTHGMGRGEYSREGFLAGFEGYNRFTHEVQLRRMAADPPPALPREKLEATWRWNRAHERLQSADDDLFVPHVMYALEGRSVRTFIAWADGTPARVPEVDFVVTPRGPVAFGVVADALAGAPRESDPIPHWIVRGETLERVFAAVDAGLASPRLLPPIAPSQIGTAEIVEEFALPESQRARRKEAFDLRIEAQILTNTGKEKEGYRKLKDAAALLPEDAELQREVGIAAYKREDYETAYEAAKRAWAVDASSVDTATLASVSAFYLALYDELLEWVERLLALSPGNTTGTQLRAIALSEAARFDESIAAFDAALASQASAMIENSRAYTLAAAGRNEEARAGYERALSMLDAELSERPADADLHSRRAYALLGLGRAKEALASAKAALKIDKDHFLALQNVGAACVSLRKWQDAVAPLRRATTFRKAAPRASFFLAKALAELGDVRGAKTALEGIATSALLRRLAAHDPTLSKLLEPSAPPESARSRAAKNEAPRPNLREAKSAAARAAKPATPSKPAASRADRASASKTKAKAKAKAKAVAKTNAKTGAKTNAKTGAKTNAKTGAKTNAKTGAKTKTGAGAKSRANPKPKARAQASVRPKARAKRAAKPKAAAKSRGKRAARR